MNRFASVPANPRYTPFVSSSSFQGSESTVVSNATISIDPLTLFPNISASLQANSGTSENSDLEKYGVAYHDGETIATVYATKDGNISHCDLLEVK